ncbi:uncharacterized protein KRP23_2750 [Phytophthora ramorum]|uniref:uncharacterized protein n=1 Tax=Phytophthora ramorum TaxID=164328 RepID=UPI00309A1D2E|nr:hypothetical protein KRP23_2750 [Phytophthora ramorum]
MHVRANTRVTEPLGDRQRLMTTQAQDYCCSTSSCRDLVPSTASLKSASWSLGDLSLPVFSRRKACSHKARDANTHVFSAPTHSSLLLPLLRPDVEKVEQALDKHLKKRAYNEYASLEHQQVHEQIEGLLENLPLPGERDSAKQTSAAAEEEVGIEEYKELLTPLEEEARRLVGASVVG